MNDPVSAPGAVPEPFGASTQDEWLNPLMALSPLDGRYLAQAAPLAPYFSEFALMRSRFRVEVEWLITALSGLEMPGAPALSAEQSAIFRAWVAEFSLADAREVKRIEVRTRHDVKAVEYHLRQRLVEADCARFAPFVHLCCTSEDINNIAHALMLREGLFDVWRPALDRCIDALSALARPHLATPMLSRTHGQPASPTTLGKELAVFVARLRRQRTLLAKIAFFGKFSGAVGNFNAHVSAYPDIAWPRVARDFLAGFGLEMQPATTQIEPHDFMAEVFHLVIRVNSVMIDLDRDIWSYISLGYLRQRLYAGEVGSSTMPHKINPIDFENSEANAGVSTALLEHLAGKLPVSRMQRDLSDSSAIRTVATGIGHSLLALKACLAGLGKVDADADEMARDLDRHWSVLAEAVQTIMRKQGVDNAYEQVKAATQDRAVDADIFRSVVEASGVTEPDLSYLLSLTPASFVGLAHELGGAALDGLD